MTERETLKQWLSESENIVFFGGAGVSTESKIPDFRSTDGLYNQQYAYPPETILSHTCLLYTSSETIIIRKKQRTTGSWSVRRRGGSWPCSRGIPMQSPCGGM